MSSHFIVLLLALALLGSLIAMGRSVCRQFREDGNLGGMGVWIGFAIVMLPIIFVMLWMALYL